jgi:hypothetical protein
MGLLHNILTEFDLSTQLIALIKLCMNASYSKFRLGKHSFVNFSYTKWSTIRRCFVATSCQC